MEKAPQFDQMRRDASSQIALFYLRLGLWMLGWRSFDDKPITVSGLGLAVLTGLIFQKFCARNELLP